MISTTTKFRKPQFTVEDYMRDVKKYPMLSEEDQKDLEVAFFQFRRTVTRNKLIHGNLRLVVKSAYFYAKHNDSVAVTDLIQEGNIGLMRGIEKFDPSKGVKASTYYSYWIRAYQLQYIMDNTGIARMGTSVGRRKVMQKLSRTQGKLTALGITPNSENISKFLGVKEEDVSDILQGMQQVMSLDGMPHRNDSGAGEGLRLDELIPDDKDPQNVAYMNIESGLIVKERMDKFEASLKDREKDIWQQRVMNEDPCMLEDMAKKYGISKERVRQIQLKIMEKANDFMHKQRVLDAIEAADPILPCA